MSNHPRWFPTAILHRGPSIYEPCNNYFNDRPIQKRFRGSLEILGWQQKARRGFEQYLKSINMTGRISSRWPGAERGRLLLRCPGRDASPAEGNLKHIQSGASVGAAFVLGRARMLQAAGEVNYAVVPPLPPFPAKVHHEAPTTPLIPPLPALIQSHQDPLHAALSMRIIMTRRLSGRTRTCAAVRYDNQAPASPL